MIIPRQMDVGSLVGGKYRIVSLLGRGGMGSVWRADHLGLNAPVAIKLMNPTLAGSAAALQRFHREAQSAAALRSPHVVQILDHGVDEATQMPFIVMELMEGESLAERLARTRALDPTETARIVGHVARALSRAHQVGIVHRDLKPDNIFLVKNEDEEIGKVLDFGIAKGDANANALSPDVATQTGAVLGTPYYMSPEQISGAKDLDHRTDTWALAVIAFECLTARRPFEADTIGGLALQVCAGRIPVPSTVAAVPPGFDEWFAHAVAHDPAQRFQDARTLAEELWKVCARVDTSPGELGGSVAPFARASSQVGTAGPILRTWADGSARPSGGKRRRRLMLATGLVALAALGVALTLYRAAAHSSEVSGSEYSRGTTQMPPLLARASGTAPIGAAAPAASELTLSVASPAEASPTNTHPKVLPPPNATAKPSVAKAKTLLPVASQPAPTAGTKLLAAPSATAAGLRSIVGSRK